MQDEAEKAGASPSSRTTACSSLAAPGGAASGGPITSAAAPSLSVRADFLTLRPGTMNDLAWIDQMQRVHAGKLGFLWAKAIRKRLECGWVRVAIDDHGTQFGFVMWGEGYSGRDDVTICYQLAVVPAHHRRLIGASLVRSWLDAVPFGMRLAVCWCAQDLPANRFWESVGFNALAWRTGSRRQQRAHIWWIRNVRQGDHFPLWMPVKTQGGAIQEERLIVPILPGQHWSDPLPALMPQGKGETTLASGLPPITQFEEDRVKRAAGEKVPGPVIGHAGPSGPEPEPPRAVVTRHGIKFIGGAGTPPPKGRSKVPRVKRVHDPELRRKLRDLRDRYLDALHSGRLDLPSSQKWDVGRVIDVDRQLATDLRELTPLLPSGSTSEGQPTPQGSDSQCRLRGCAAPTNEG